jgi:hypothetical protein
MRRAVSSTVIAAMITGVCTVACCALTTWVQLRIQTRQLKTHVTETAQAGRDAQSQEG